MFRYPNGIVRIAELFAGWRSLSCRGGNAARGDDLAAAAAVAATGTAAAGFVAAAAEQIAVQASGKLGQPS